MLIWKQKVALKSEAAVLFVFSINDSIQNLAIAMTEEFV